MMWLLALTIHVSVWHPSPSITETDITIGHCTYGVQVVTNGDVLTEMWCGK